jgi:hypothetical protein
MEPSADPNPDTSSQFSAAEISATSNGDDVSKYNPVAPSATSSGDGSSQHSNMAASFTSSGDGLPPFPLHNKLLEQVVRPPGRQPSPQPTHLGVPGASHSNNSRILHETGPGYVAPKFEGKEQQMEDGMHALRLGVFVDKVADRSKQSSISSRRKDFYRLSLLSPRPSGFITP